MFGGLENPTHWLIVIAIALIVLGPKRLPEAGRALGTSLRGFKDAIAGEDEKPTVTRAVAAPDPAPVVTQAVAVPEPAPVVQSAGPAGPAGPAAPVADEPAAPPVA